ncbi:sigma 54-interacting transcriptional regulator [Chitiniphilus purpureus]|uniref:Sigma 54-interacting transcriptional regulator n=1 Tax=Chitiniphilus purpureus TaxID=2981137 RepID=A0ABY6DS85_9NEIS|nr:sigma 54-interacting transcriptional regulator [Chitiniphilus sp. CD1]UXY17234.1 sigma 54-interacting transcriptional regulator [Chitiniphilus sp. CD1]
MPIADVVLVCDGLPLDLLLDAGPAARVCLISPGCLAGAPARSCQPRLVLVPLLDDASPCPHLAARLERRWPGVPVLVVGRPGGCSADTALAAGYGGLLDRRSARRLIGALALPGSPPPAGQASALVGQSAAMRDVRRKLERFAVGDSTLLITGETGTGKDLIARQAHALSARAGQPFVALNCAALPETLIESELFGYEKGAFTGAGQAYKGKIRMAEGGTLFLDEIGDMPLPAQARMLRVIENREVFSLGASRAQQVDVRLVAATNQALEARVQQGVFRKDLFYRLNVARLALPPLRERQEDLDALIALFMGRQVPLALTSAVRARLYRHDWPGNVRELKNVLEAARLSAQGARIELADLPDYLQQGAGELPADERCRILDALRAAGGNKSEAAHQLHWSRMTLYRKLAKHGLHGALES